jgi:cysteine desulfuration protein SufE
MRRWVGDARLPSNPNEQVTRTNKRPERRSVAPRLRSLIETARCFTDDPPMKQVSLGFRASAAMPVAWLDSDYTGILLASHLIGEDHPIWTEQPMSLDEIIENFNYLDDWEDRYRYLIELGRMLEPLDEAAHNDTNKVLGCASQVWLETRIATDPEGMPVLNLKGDSDAHIVRGLVALILALYSGKTAPAILTTDAQALFQSLGLSAHLTPQRTNGVRSMVERIKNDARVAAATAA